MGASVAGFWQGMTRAQLDSHPCFSNDCKAWGEWMVERYKHPAIIALHKSLGVDALLSFTSAGIKLYERRTEETVAGVDVDLAASRSAPDLSVEHISRGNGVCLLCRCEAHLEPAS
jgi:hypothetical protein